ncbi:MAG TPA: class I SAM-dependent methyltransferase [Kofleriaceae bacterium]|nr:class I SAM-dependent methyltransferase [Kofleriaceae bacterium]
MEQPNPPTQLRKAYVPALGFHWLTALYDPLIRSWSAAARMRRAVIDALDLRAGLRILELGSGPGRLAIQIKRGHGEVTIDAVDIDERMVASAKHNAAGAGVDIEFREADMTCLAEHGTYDRVYSTMTFHHLMPDAKYDALAAARRALAPGGRFVIADFGRPRDPLQWALFAWIQQPLDGFQNTRPHRDGRFERALRDTFSHVHSAEAWRTVAGTVELFVCSA